MKKVHAMIAILAIAIAGWMSHGALLAGQGRGGGGRGAAAPSPYPVTQAKTYKFEKIAENVYYATGGNGGNMPVVIGSRDVLVMDTGTTPATARAFLQDVKVITDKPIRWAVNSHYHYDHTDGNQVFREIGADVVAHEFVRYAIANYDILHREPYMTSQAVRGPERVETLTKQLAEEKDPQRKATLQTQLTAAKKNFDDLKEIKLTPPNVTYTDKKIIDLGGREVQLLFLGRGHTNGDTVIYLPAEKIAATGDLMEYGPAYMGDGKFNEWGTTLENLKKLDVAIMLPGHGIPFTDVKPRITAFQGYLREVVKQTTELRKQGLTPVQAAEKIDLSAYKDFFAGTARPGAELRGIRRIYEWLYDMENKEK